MTEVVGMSLRENINDLFDEKAKCDVYKLICDVGNGCKKNINIMADGMLYFHVLLFPQLLHKM